MRSSRVFTLMTGVALIAACGDGGNDPSNTAPAAAFTYECTNLTCTFTDRSADEDGTIASRSWDFGDASTGTALTATHTYAGAGDYTVTVEATDNGGLTDTSDPQTVTVTAASPTVQADFDVACTGLTCALTNASTATGGTATYLWTFGGGVPNSTEQDPAPVVYSVTAPTTFTITLVATNGAATSQATKQVRVSPAATLTCNGVACALVLDQASTVVVTLQTVSCQAHGNTFVITAPTVETLFTDGCFSTPGTPFLLNNGDVYAAGTELSAEVQTGVAGAENPQLRVTGTFEDGWTLEFDDGFVGAGEPDFNDLVIRVVATPQ